MTRWDEFMPVLVERMNATIDAQPESLLEQDGGPLGRTADVVLARLIGFDDQVVADWRIREVAPELYMPISERLTAVEPDPNPVLRKARYVLQSGYATYDIAPEYAPPDVKPGPPNFLVSVLFVRYRRRS